MSPSESSARSAARTGPARRIDRLPNVRRTSNVPSSPQRQPKKRAPAKKAARKRAAKKIGRPTIRTPEVEQRIVEGLAKGTPLTVICRADDMPAWQTVYDWMAKDSELSVAIARAREVGADVIAWEALRIADTPEEGIETTETPDGPRVKRGDMLGHRRLQVETRLKLLAKWDPKRYGERIAQELSGPEGGPIKTESKMDPEKERKLDAWLDALDAECERETRDKG